MARYENDIEMVTISDDTHWVLKERHAYGPTGEPRSVGPRCHTCGDLGAWGTHPLCATDDRDRLLVHWRITEAEEDELTNVADEVDLEDCEDCEDCQERRG